MSLFNKTLLAVLSVTLLSLVSAILIQYFLVLPDLQALEAEADRKEVVRVVMAFEGIRERLEANAYDYGVWDETFDYFHNNSETYLTRNYVLDTFLINQWNIVAMADRQRRPFWVRHVDLAGQQFQARELLPVAELTPYFITPSEQELNSAITESGFVATSHGPMSFAAVSVLPSDVSGVSPGSLLLGQFIDEVILDELRTRYRINMRIETLSEDEANSLLNSRFEDLHRDPDNRIRWFIGDTSGQPLFAVDVQLDGRMYEDHLVSWPVVASVMTLLVSFGILLLILQRVLVQPIHGIVQHLERIRETDDYSLRLAYRRRDELGTLADECDRLFHNIEQQREILNQQSADLHRLSFEDGLTGLANRRRLDQLLQEHLAIAQRQDLPLVLMLCDVDFFKDYNDSYGHQRGDDVLVQVADVLFSSINRETDYAARYGGEEFAVLLPNTLADGASIVVERIAANLRGRKILHERSRVSRHLTMSTGIAAIEADEQVTASELLARADQALYDAKHKGRNRAVFYSKTKTTADTRTRPPAGQNRP